MLAQQGIGIWAIINGLGNAEADMTVGELLIQAKVSEFLSCERHTQLLLSRSPWGITANTEVRSLLPLSTTWIFSTTAVKLAVLALYMRIFTTPTFKRWAISLGIIDICFGITFLVVFITHCSPVSQQWAPVPWGWCRSLTSAELSSISSNLVLDTAIVILPMPWLWNLHMPLGKKIVVMVMFSFGFA